LLCFVTVLAGVVAEADADAPLRDVLAAALDANRELARLTAELRAENARLREENELLRAENAEQAAELEKLRADLAVLQRMVFGRSTERSGPGGGACRVVDRVDYPGVWQRRGAGAGPGAPERQEGEAGAGGAGGAAGLLASSAG
jgi:transposase